MKPGLHHPHREEVFSISNLNFIPFTLSPVNHNELICGYFHKGPKLFAPAHPASTRQDSMGTQLTAEGLRKSKHQQGTFILFATIDSTENDR